MPRDDFAAGVLAGLGAAIVIVERLGDRGASEAIKKYMDEKSAWHDAREKAAISRERVAEALAHEKAVAQEPQP